MVVVVVVVVVSVFLRVTWCMVDPKIEYLAKK